MVAEHLGRAYGTAQHVEALVPALVCHFEQVGAVCRRPGQEARPESLLSERLEIEADACHIRLHDSRDAAVSQGGG